ncbi:MAG: V-type ATP synthase subunit D [Kiritimatiellia bacterium]
MAHIKHTKNELRAQREALKRFERFLPMLQLKQKQLKAELRQVEVQIAQQEAALESGMKGLDAWVALFSEMREDRPLVDEPEVLTDTANIAGVVIPVLREVRTRRHPIDLFATPPWFDEAQEFLESVQRAHAALAVLREQHRLLATELRTTTQRVNLFEKVKIPECRENIRIIRIFLGDEQTAAVVRAKFAKGRAEAAGEEGVLHGGGLEGMETT